MTPTTVGAIMAEDIDLLTTDRRDTDHPAIDRQVDDLCNPCLLDRGQDRKRDRREEGADDRANRPWSRKD